MTRLCASTLHKLARKDRPPAGYTLHAMPCQTRTCEGRLCLGHPLCPECVAAIRSGAVVWTGTREDVEVLMVATR